MIMIVKIGKIILLSTLINIIKSASELDIEKFLT